MANPSNRGIGTGTAQIFDTSRIDDAMNRLADIKFRKDVMFAEGEAEAEKRKAAAIAELRGEFKDYDTNKLMLEDVPEFLSKYNNVQKKYSGNWGKILNGDPKLSNEYRADLDDIKRFVARSVDTKPKAQEFWKSIKDSNLYSEKAKLDYIRRSTTPGYNYNEDLRSGLLSRDVVRPDFVTNIIDLFPEKGDEFYKKEKTKVTRGDGSHTFVDSKTWKDDLENYNIFKTAVNSNVDMITDINLKYQHLVDKNLSEEENIDRKMNAAYNDLKTVIKSNEKEVDIQAAQDDKSTGKSPYEGIVATPYNFKGELGVNIGGEKGLRPTSFSYDEGGKQNIIVGTPSEVFKGKDGEFRVRVNPKEATYKPDGTIEYADVEKGELKIIKLNRGGKGEAAFVSSYGKTPEQFWNEAHSQKPSPSTPKKGETIDGYVFLGGDPSNQKNWKKQ